MFLKKGMPNLIARSFIGKGFGPVFTKFTNLRGLIRVWPSTAWTLKTIILVHMG